MTRDEPILSNLVVYFLNPSLKFTQDIDEDSIWGINKNNLDFLVSNPVSILYSALLNNYKSYVVSIETALKLYINLGHLNPEIISRMEGFEIYNILKKSGVNFEAKKAYLIINASKMLVNKYDADVNNIWSKNECAKIVVNRLEEFDGIGTEMSIMIIYIITTFCKIKLNDINKIDFKIDNNCARVFLRSGLVKSRENIIYEVNDLNDMIISVIKSFNYLFPAMLTQSASEIGKNWCKATGAACLDYKGLCPLESTCSKKVDVNVF